jgi:hypothetical protein
MEMMMAASSANLVSILTKMQDGNEVDKSKKEAEKSILKAMGPTQRNLFLALCTEEMDVIPEMSVFMTNLTSCKTPQKAISLLQSEAREWEGTFSPGAMHKLLSNGFLSQEANRANPGGFTIFSFFPKTVEVHGKSTGNELLREYLGMDADEATLSFYAKQGYFPVRPSRHATDGPGYARTPDAQAVGRYSRVILRPTAVTVEPDDHDIQRQV